MTPKLKLLTTLFGELNKIMQYIPGRVPFHVTFDDVVSHREACILITVSQDVLQSDKYRAISLIERSGFHLQGEISTGR